MRTARARLVSFSVFVALFVTACGGGGSGPVIPSGPSASSSFDSPVLTGTLAARETRQINVRIPSSLRSTSSRLVIDVVASSGDYPFNLVLYFPGASTPMASTAGPQFFAPGLEGLDRGLPSAAAQSDDRRPAPTANPGVGRSQTGLPFCEGACLARSAPSSLAYVTIEVENVFNASTDFELYAYVERYGQIDSAGRVDANEPANNSLSGAAVVSTAESYIGLIDRVVGLSGGTFRTDEDYVQFAQGGTIELAMFAYPDVVNIRMDLFDGLDGSFLATLTPGDSFFVLSGDYGRVYTSGSDQRMAVYGPYEVFYR